MTRRIFVDTEWTAPPWSERSELLWIGLADEAGHVWSAISADVDIDPASNDFTAGLWKHISPDDPRSTTDEIAAGVRAFCGDVDEFWAWIPTLESFTEWSGLGSDAPDVYAAYRDWDLQLLQRLVDPWPDDWPNRLLDLNTAAVEAGVELPLRKKNHLAPDVHVVWNRQLFERIQHAQKG